MGENAGKVDVKGIGNNMKKNIGFLGENAGKVDVKGVGVNMKENIVKESKKID